MEYSSEVLKISTPEKGIVQISLNRPQALNALSHELLTALSNVLFEIKNDKNIKAVLLTGEGKAFCAGADIKQLASLNGTAGLEFARFGQQVFRQFETLGKPSLAAIHGYAFGGGCELAMAATIRIAALETAFSQPEIKLGVIPGFGGTQRLSRLIGKGRAMEVCLTGRRFNAEEAHLWGLVSEVTTSENLLVRAKAILKDLSQQSATAMRSIMTVIQQGYDLPLEDALELEAVNFGLCCTTADKKEGVSAFIEKRAAVFSGE